MATKSGVSICMRDMVVPTDKNTIIARAEKEIREAQKQFQGGLLTDDERYNKSVDLWDKAGEEISRVMMDGLSREDALDETTGENLRDKKGEVISQKSFTLFT